MSGKDVQLRKRLIKNAIIAIGALTILLVGAAVISVHNDDALSEKHVKETDSSAKRSEVDAIKLQLNTKFDVSSFYDAYIKHHNDTFVLNREAATQLLTTLREKHHLVNLEVTIAPITDVPGENFQLKTGVMVKSEVKLIFNGLSDNSVYGFIEAIQGKLPGMVIVNNLKLTRTNSLSRNILLDLSQHKITPMISGELSFIWVGIRPKTEGKPVNGASNVR